MFRKAVTTRRKAKASFCIKYKYNELPISVTNTTINIRSGVARILVRGRHSDDTILGGPGASPPENFLKFGSLKRHFLHFEGTFEENI